MITTNVESTLYALGDDRETIRIDDIIPFLGSQPYRLRRNSRIELVNRFRRTQDSVSEEFPDLLAFLVLSASEVEQREVIRKRTNTKLRGIRLEVSTVPMYLRDTLAPGWRKKTRTKGEHDMEKEEDFDLLVSETLGPFKVWLGLPSVNPVALAYPVSDGVIARATTPDCQRYLEILATEGPVFSWQFDQICQHLQAAYPADAEPVVLALTKGKTREHLSALSLTAKGRDSTVTMVNPGGRILIMQARKFETLIEHCGGTKLLGVIGAKPYDFASSVVEFTTTIQKGEVIAHYETKTSILHVGVLKESDNEVGDSSTFVIDNDSVVCMYLAIRRQRVDRRRFEQLLDEAETRIEVDPFRHLIQKDR